MISQRSQQHADHEANQERQREYRLDWKIADQAEQAKAAARKTAMRETMSPASINCPRGTGPGGLPQQRVP